MNNETNELLEEIVNAHGIGAVKDWQKYWPANYNVAPTQDVPVAASRGGQRSIETVRWGMVAPYAKEFGGKPTINARIETVATNGMFKGPFREHRVVVAALGYYEWQDREDGKQPYFIHLPGEPLALAGIVRTWHDKSKTEGDPERSAFRCRSSRWHVTPGEVHDCPNPYRRAPSWTADGRRSPFCPGILGRRRFALVDAGRPWNGSEQRGQSTLGAVFVRAFQYSDPTHTREQSGIL